MKNIKATTKKGVVFIESYNRIDGYTLNDCYSNYSYAKQKAYNDCLEMCNCENGRNFHIISHNTFGFSVAWKTEKGVRIETPQNSYLIA